jgi:ATP-dependent Clp protease ATP-binding subunit ClpB
MFTPLSREDIRDVVRLQLAQLKKALADQHITIDATEEAIAYLADKGFDPQYGARPIKRTIQREVLNNLSREILKGSIHAESIVLIDSFEDELVFRNQNELVE